jgi:hydrogenase maturation protease
MGEESPRILVIGIGNDYRSDDRAGLFIARQLKQLLPHGVEVIEQSGEGAALIDSWRDAEEVFIIDAVYSGDSVGEIHRFEAHAEPVPTIFSRYSTHAFSLAEAIELARALGQLPSKVIIYGIEAKQFGSGTKISPEVRRAAEKVVRRVIEEIG